MFEKISEHCRIKCNKIIFNAVEKNIWKENKTVIIILAYIVAVAAAAFFLFFPLVKSIYSASDKIQESIIDRKIEEDRLSQLPQMESDWSNYEAKKESLNVILSQENEIEFIESIESIANKSGCVINLSIGEKADQNEIKKIKKVGIEKNKDEKGILESISNTNFFPVQINLKGDYDGIVNFIHMLENSWIYANIITIQISKELVKSENNTSTNIFSKAEESKDENKKEILNVSLNVIVYIKDDES